MGERRIATKSIRRVFTIKSLPKKSKILPYRLLRSHINVIATVPALRQRSICALAITLDPAVNRAASC